MSIPRGFLSRVFGLEIITTSFGGNVGLPSPTFQDGLTGRSEGLKEGMVVSSALSSATLALNVSVASLCSHL